MVVLTFVGQPRNAENPALDLRYSAFGLTASLD